MFKKQFLLILFLIIIVLIPANTTLAGFGVSPPAVISDKILPGSHFEQKITLLRSSAENILFASVVINAPEIRDWITIDKGDSFEFPAGEMQMPIVVNIDPPKNAAIGSYQGTININVSEDNNIKSSGIELGVGAQINIDIKLTRDIYRDFLVRTVNITDLELPKKPWDMPIFSWFFRRLKVNLKIENIGNEKIAPTKVVADIYDITESNFLSSVEDRSLKKILPFKTDNIIAFLPLQIGAGQYWARIKTYKDKDIVSSDKIAFTIIESGVFKKSDLVPWLIILIILICIWFVVSYIFKIKITKQGVKFFKFCYLIVSRFIKYIKFLILKLKTRFWHFFYNKIIKDKNK